MKMTHVQLLRYSRGLTSGDVARRMGSAQATVSRFETGNRKVTDEWLKRYAWAVEASVDEVARALRRGKCKKLESVHLSRGESIKSGVGRARSYPKSPLDSAAS